MVKRICWTTRSKTDHMVQGKYANNHYKLVDKTSSNSRWTVMSICRVNSVKKELRNGECRKMVKTWTSCSDPETMSLQTDRGMRVDENGSAEKMMYREMCTSIEPDEPRYERTRMKETINITDFTVKRSIHQNRYHLVEQHRKQLFHQIVLK